MVEKARAQRARGKIDRQTCPGGEEAAPLYLFNDEAGDQQSLFGSVLGVSLAYKSPASRFSERSKKSGYLRGS